jgi:hypothetical protein
MLHPVRQILVFVCFAAVHPHTAGHDTHDHDHPASSTFNDATQFHDAHAHSDHHDCIHDKLPPLLPHQQRRLTLHGGGGGGLSGAEHSRRLKAGAKPLRIKWRLVDGAADLTGADGAALEALITSELMPAAIDFWAAALKVVPVSGALHYPAFCSSRWNDAGKRCAGVSAAAMCGAVKVPDDLVKGQYHCKDSSTTGCTTSTPDGIGAIGADLFLLVTAKDTDCSGTTQAYAGPCARDEFGRPVFGYLNFCKSTLIAQHVKAADANSLWRKSGRVSVARHELAHVLGFSSGSFHLFRDEAGNARTPAKRSDSTSCGGVHHASVKTSHSVLNVISSFAERGSATCAVDPVGSNADSNCLFKMTSPAVLAKGREFFGCDTLNGVELENQPTTGGCR